MDGKDVERLIEVMENNDCIGCPEYVSLLNARELVRAERAKVIAELKDWMTKNEDYNSIYGAIVNTAFLEMKLDSMEPDKGDKL